MGDRSWLWWVPVLAVVASAAGCSPAQQPAAPSPSASSPAPVTTAPTPTPEPTATPTPTVEPVPEPEPDPVTRIEVTLADGRAEPNGDKVELAKGDTVEFVVTSDRDDELHVHGVDVEIPVEAGETVTRRIVVDKTGRFEVESHHPELLIVQLVVR